MVGGAARLRGVGGRKRGDAPPPVNGAGWFGLDSPH